VSVNDISIFEYRVRRIINMFVHMYMHAYVCIHMHTCDMGWL